MWTKWTSFNLHICQSVRMEATRNVAHFTVCTGQTNIWSDQCRKTDKKCLFLHFQIGRIVYKTMQSENAYSWCLKEMDDSASLSIKRDIACIVSVYECVCLLVCMHVCVRVLRKPYSKGPQQPPKNRAESSCSRVGHIRDTSKRLPPPASSDHIAL